MFFRKRKFFLDLSDQQGTEQEAKAGKGPEPKVTIAPPAAPASKEKTAASPPAPQAETPRAAEAAPAAQAAPALRTTAEEIAAQLAAEAANQPAPTLATFATDCLVPGGATPRRRRKAGANLGAFKEIARGLMKS